MKEFSKPLTDISHEERQAFWNKVGTSFKEVRSAYSTTIYGDGEWRLFRKYFGDLKGKKVLKLDVWNEVNNTSILDRAVHAGAEVTGLDISDELVKRARENFARKGMKAEFVVSDIRDMKLPDNTFDFLYTMGTIEHVPNPEKAVQEIHRVLKKGGIAVVGVPYRFDPFGRAAFLWIGNKLGFLPYGEEKCFSWKQFRRLMDAADFEYLDRSGAYFMPWPLRFADMYLHQKFPILCYPLRPFLYLCKLLGNNNFLLAHNSLIAYVVKKK